MSSRHHIDDFMRGRIIGNIEEGRKITDVAREFDIAHSVVSRLWKSFKTTGMCSRRHGGGRVRSTTPAEDRYIVLSAKGNRHTTAQQVANQFLAASGKQISRKSVDRRLRGGGLYAGRPVVGVPLTRQHRTARLQWCREHHNWTEQDWACVLFSDEETLTVQDCLDSEGIQRLVWPARSPDLKPIENVWDALERQVAARNYPPTNKNTLIRALTEKWDKLPQQLLDNVVQCMVRRVDCCITLHDHSAEYQRCISAMVKLSYTNSIVVFFRRYGLSTWGIELRGSRLKSPSRGSPSLEVLFSEPDLVTTSESEILEEFSDQGVIQVRRITIKKNATVFSTKHLILTINSPDLPTSIKVGYLNCKIRPYIPNPLRCFKCQRFGHSQTSCGGQLTCSRCASVGHASTDCILEPKCFNCSQPHTADSKLFPKWKNENQIQEIKTNKNITYVEARKLIVPQTSYTYAQAAKSSNKNSSTQTDESITKIKCPPLELLQPISSKTRTNLSISTPDVSTSSSSTQAQLLPSTSSISTSNSESQPPIPTCNDAPSNTMVTPIESFSSIIPVC
ncbi:RNA-directed DNA polymerase from mobile element jockey [Trichonephila clavipes]|nr:RNA-directed DNA polymerase from mobile element jockey [Trichonephila clavipes]